MTKSEQILPVFNNKLCMSCIMCADVCPSECILYSVSGKKNDPHKYPYLLNEELCIGCRSCEKECPVDAIEMRPAAMAS